MRKKILLTAAGVLIVLFLHPGLGEAGCSQRAGAWTECPDYALLDASAQCTTVSVPLDYSNPSGEQIDIFVFRYLGSSTEKKGQIWFLEGGPGCSGLVLAKRMAYLAQLYPDFDYYSLDHRGVGGSARIGCQGDNGFTSDQPRYEECLDTIIVAWGDKIRYFTTTNAARDVYQVISHFREDGKKLFIYSTSYGTYWLLRYLQLYPEGADGVILDSVCTPGDCYLDRYDGWHSLVGSQFLDICQADPVCSQKMATIGGNPAQVMEQTFEKLDNGQLCPQVVSTLDRKTFRKYLVWMLDSWTERVLIPPLIYRLNRCNPSDQRAVRLWLDSMSKRPIAPPEGLEPYISPMLGDLIALSELYGGYTLAEVTEIAEKAFFSEDQSLRLVTYYYAGMWPLYSDPEYAQKFPTTDIPMLMMNGTTDPQTPLEVASKAANVLNGRYQHFVTVPYATHGVIQNSPIDQPWPSGQETCGSRLIGQFINNPTGELDTSCTGEVYPLEFSGGSAINQGTSQSLFGTNDMWEGVVPHFIPAGGAPEADHGDCPCRR